MLVFCCLIERGKRKLPQEDTKIDNTERLSESGTQNKMVGHPGDAFF